MDAVGRLSAGHEESKKKTAKKPVFKDDPHRPFADPNEFTAALKSLEYKGLQGEGQAKRKRAEVADRAGLWSVIRSNRPAPAGLLGDDLRRKGASPQPGAPRVAAPVGFGAPSSAPSFWLAPAGTSVASGKAPVHRVHDQRVQTIDPLIQDGYVPHTHSTLSGRDPDHGRRGPAGLEGAGALLGLGLAGALLYAGDPPGETERERDDEAGSGTPKRTPEEEKRPDPAPPPWPEPKEKPEEDEQDEAAYFRVQGERAEVQIRPDGGILINTPGEMLFVSVEDPHHARYYLREKRPGPNRRVLAFDVPLDLHRRIIADLVPQRGAKKNRATRGRSQLVDTKQPGISIGVAPPWFEELQLRANDAELIEREEFFRRYGHEDPERPWTTSPRGQNAPGFRR